MWIGLIIGIFIGGFLGVLIMSLLTVSRDSSKHLSSE